MSPGVAPAWTFVITALGHLSPMPAQFSDLPGLFEGLLTPQGVFAFGAGVLGVGGVRYFLKRRSQSAEGIRIDASDLLGEDVTELGGPGTTLETAEPAAEPDRVIKQTAHGHSKKPDVAFTLPSFLPISRGIREVSHDEVHALELGLLVGLITAWLYVEGRIELTVSLLAVFVAGVLGYKRYRSKAFKTVRYEPWYALIAFAVGAGLGYLLFEVGIALPLTALP